ncbi:ParB/RepB/Spo0J family partition protein, partial [Enterococcus faecalis]|uniref:ParB/RepB/Spo0J family partition protein n=1 Tax=Enterococcus faecalis TaxID=1351 RepID=UPI003D6BF6D7
DEFVAFAALMAPGNRSPADLAKQFGFTERYVKQRLRLAGLADEILDALRQGQISLEVATEYAKTADHALQSRVYKRECRPNNYQR